MLRSMLIAFTLTLLATAALAAPEIGKPAPDFTATDSITGKPLRLSDLKGKTVVLEWNNFGCPFVKKFYSVGAMQGVQAKAKADGVVWVSVNSSATGKEGHLADAKAVKQALADNRSNAAHYVLDHNGAIGHAYEAKTTPHMFVIDKGGNLAYKGAIDDKPTADSADIASATNYVTAALNALAKGKPVKTAETKAYGCFVKYE